MQQAGGPGVFDRPNTEGVTTKPASTPEHSSGQVKAAPESMRKAEFQTPFEQNESLVRGHHRGSGAAKIKKREYAEEAADKINQATGTSADLTEEYKEEMSISKDDLELAEQLIFKGYAEKDVEILAFPGHKFTVCSTNAEEVSMIDEIIFDMIKEKELDDGRIDLPQNHIQTWRNALYVALSYRGMDKIELCQSGRSHLNTIKKAIAKVVDYEMLGEIKKSEELKSDLKKSLRERAVSVRRLPTPLIDFISEKKLSFDQAMTSIMSKKDVVRKS